MVLFLQLPGLTHPVIEAENGGGTTHYDPLRSTSKISTSCPYNLMLWWLRGLKFQREKCFHQDDFIKLEVKTATQPLWTLRTPESKDKNGVLCWLEPLSSYQGEMRLLLHNGQKEEYRSGI